MRLEPESPPYPRHRRLRHAGRGGHRPGRPMRRVPWCLLQGLDDHPLHVVIADQPRSTRARLVMEPVETMLHEPGPPLVHRVAIQTEPPSDLSVRTSLRAGQHDPTPHRQRLRGRVPASPPLERLRARHRSRPVQRASCPVDVPCLTPIVVHHDHQNARAGTQNSSLPTKMRLRSLEGHVGCGGPFHVATNFEGASELENKFVATWNRIGALPPGSRPIPTKSQ